MNKIKDLKEIKLFGNLSDAGIHEFLKTFRQVSFKNGEVIFKEGSAGETFFIIASGRVIIEKKLDTEGRKFKQLAILSRGDFFGEMAVIENQPRFAQARAMEDVVLYELDRKKLLDFISRSPETGANFLIEIIQVILKRLRHTSNELLMLHGFVEVLANAKYHRK